MAAGGLWGGSLALLAQQDGVGVVTLLGGAGAVIGGGTAWGITRFGLRPSAAQALWFTNSTAWGSLAGLTIWSGSGSDSAKLKYGLLVGGETLGIVAGAWSARRYHFTPGQTVFADSLVIGSGLGLAGASMMLDSDSPWQVTPAAAIGVVPDDDRRRGGRPPPEDLRRRRAAAADGAPAGGLDGQPAGGGWLPGTVAGHAGAAPAGPCWAWGPDTWARRRRPASSRFHACG